MATHLNLPIEDLLPHDHPMILLDGMVEADRNHNICSLLIRPGIMFCDDRGVPAFVGIEYMAQAVAAHGGYLGYLDGEPVRIGFLLGSPRFVSHVARFPLGQELLVEVVREWGDAELMRFACSIRDKGDGRLLQEAGLNVYHPKDLEDYLGSNRSG